MAKFISSNWYPSIWQPLYSIFRGIVYMESAWHFRQLGSSEQNHRRERWGRYRDWEFIWFDEAYVIKISMIFQKRFFHLSVVFFFFPVLSPSLMKHLQAISYRAFGSPRKHNTQISIACFDYLFLYWKMNTHIRMHQIISSQNIYMLFLE